MKMRELILYVLLFLLLISAFAYHRFYVQSLQKYIKDMEKERETFVKELSEKLDTLFLKDNEREVENLPPVFQKAKEMLEEEFFIEKKKSELEILIPSDEIFLPGGYEISEDGEKRINNLVVFLKQIPYKEIEVGVHTDDVPVATKKELFPSNWELAARRATEITRRIIEKNGAKSENIYAVSYGDSRPIDPLKTESARKKNRRVVFKIRF